MLLCAEGTAGQAYSCCDRYVSEFEVATLANQISNGAADIQGASPTPKHRIVTEKLRGLGMEFGGRALLEETVTQLVAAVP